VDDELDSQGKPSAITFQISGRILIAIAVVVGAGAIALAAFVIGRSTEAAPPGNGSPTTIPSPTTTPTTSVTATTTVALPGIPPCEAAGVSPVIRPMSLYLACADGGLGVTNVTWTSWGTVAANGMGTLHVNNCIPDCADGTSSSYPASISVTSPSSSSGVPIFQDITVVPTGGQGQVESSTTPGAWGAP
jgi:hypothetical protein